MASSYGWSKEEVLKLTHAEARYLSMRIGDDRRR